MIWVGRETWDKKKRRRGEWHTAFLWFPRTITELGGKRVNACFRYVERKGYHDGDWWRYEYRFNQKDVARYGDRYQFPNWPE